MHLQDCTVFIEKNPHTSGSMQCKPMLFKDQLDFNVVFHRKNISVGAVITSYCTKRFRMKGLYILVCVPLKIGV